MEYIKTSKLEENEKDFYIKVQKELYERIRWIIEIYYNDILNQIVIEITLSELDYKISVSITRIGNLEEDYIIEGVIREIKCKIFNKIFKNTYMDK